jgi:hypothetical protein
VDALRDMVASIRGKKKAPSPGRGRGRNHPGIGPAGNPGRRRIQPDVPARSGAPRAPCPVRGPSASL